MNKAILIAVIISVLFLFGFARESRLNAQPISSDTDLKKNLYLYDEAMREKPQDIKTAQRIRDGIERYVKGLIDDDYDKYADNLYKNRNRQSIPNPVSDYVTGIGTATKPDSLADSDCAKKNAAVCFLSSITSDRTGKKPSKELTAEILLRAMDIARIQVAAEIEEKMKLDVTAYPLSSVRHDLRRYYFAGTPIGATQALSAILEKLKK